MAGVYVRPGDHLLAKIGRTKNQRLTSNATRRDDLLLSISKQSAYDRGSHVRGKR
jgi:hypothetical protein